MTTTPPEAPSGPPPSSGGPSDSGPRVDRDQVRDLGRLRRSMTDRKVAGVAGGLGRHLDVDPLVLRVAFVVLVFFGGAGLILYGAAWLLVPEEGSPRAPFNLDERSRTVALVIVGVIATVALVGDSWGAFWFPWPLAVVALVAIWLLTRNAAKNPPPTPPAPYGPTHPPAAPAQENPYVATAHLGTYHPQPYGPMPPPPYVPPAPVRAPNRRKRGPILFWFTLALIALCEGILGIVDVAGASVAGSAYPALAVGIIGLMLVVGAFFGRAGGLILAGLVATVGLGAATAAEHWDSDEIRETPTTASSVEGYYSVGVGELVLDLREVRDLDSLDGRTIRLDGDFGHLEVILPDGLASTVSADVDGPGSIDLFGVDSGGIGVTKHDSEGFGSSAPEINIDARLGVGEIEVRYR